MTRTGDSTVRPNFSAIGRIFVTFTILLFSVSQSFAATSIEIRQVGSAYAPTVSAQNGQTLSFEIWADVESDSARGVAFYVSFPSNEFSVVDQNTGSAFVVPFNNTNAAFGSFQENRFYADTVDTAIYTRMDGGVTLPGSFTKSGLGLVATFQLWVTSNQAGASIPITIDYDLVPLTRNTRYATIAGTSTDFQVRRSVTVNIALATNIDKITETVTEYGLHQNYPNPFNPETMIRYDLATQSPVKLSVYNLLGQQVATLVDALQSAGSHRIAWNGRNGNGQVMPAGMYIYRLEAGAFRESRRMLLLK
jgi:hypothetical protein